MFDMFSIPLYSMAEIFFYFVIMCSDCFLEWLFFRYIFVHWKSFSSILQQSHNLFISNTNLTRWLCWCPTAMVVTVWACRCVFTYEKNKKTVMLGKARVHIALETMPRGDISKQTKNRSVTWMDRVWVSCEGRLCNKYRKQKRGHLVQYW